MYIVFKKIPKKNATLLEKLIAFFTKSDVIHVELSTIKRNNSFYGYTSEPFKGVVSRWVKYNEEYNDYEFIHIDLDINKLKIFYNSTAGKKYDYLGVLGFVFGTKQNPNRYFCSEWVSEVLGISNPSKITPAKLYKMFK